MPSAILPKYANELAAGIPVPDTILMSFPGTTMQIFPLRADIARLRRFCDFYLNFIDDPKPAPFYYRPAAPFVFMLVVDYGRLSVETDNIGWFSQHEAFFAIPLEWYRIVNGRQVFIDWGITAPFIYVDHPLSVVMGREVYGWPKVQMRYNNFQPAIPTERSRLASISLNVPGESSGRNYVSFIDVFSAPARLRSWRNLPSDIYSPLPEAFSGSVAWLGAAADMLSGLPVFGYARDRSVEASAAMIRKWFEYIAALFPSVSLARPSARQVRNFDLPALGANVFNLKQFRDAEDPGCACYQAIIQSTMYMDRLNDGGLSFNPLWGDPSGGITIQLHHEYKHPIAEQLGLEPSTVRRDRSGSGTTLSPFFPFWLNFDLTYGIGEAICWRSRKGDWSVTSGERPAPDTKVDRTHSETERDRLKSKRPDEPPPRKDARYVTLGSGALLEVAGPFTVGEATIRVLPLRADSERLRSACAEYAGESSESHDGGSAGARCPYRLEPWGHLIYMVVTTFDDLNAPDNAVGLHADQEVEFLLPIRWRDDTRPNVNSSLGLLSVFQLVESQVASITFREVYGHAAAQATFERPSDAWMEASGPSESIPESLLRVRTPILPILFSGEQIQRLPLLEIIRADDLARLLPSTEERPSEEWRQGSIAAHAKQISSARNNESSLQALKALALEVLAFNEPLNVLSLKQFRDARHLDCACYQALVLNRWRIRNIRTIQEIEHRLLVRLNEYPSLPIVNMLGLRPSWTESGPGSVVHVLEALRPFWFKASLVQEPDDTATNLCWRVRDKRWQLGELPPGGLLFEGADGRNLHSFPARAEDLRDHTRRTKVRRDFAASLDTLSLDPETAPEVRANLEGAARQLARDCMLKEAEEVTRESAHEARYRDEIRATYESSDPAALAFADIHKLFRLVEATGAPGGAGKVRSGRVTLGEALEATRHITPQMVIETILSSAWGNREWPAGRKKQYDFCIRRFPGLERMVTDAKENSNSEYYWGEGKATAGHDA